MKNNVPIHIKVPADLNIQSAGKSLTMNTKRPDRIDPSERE